MNNKQQYIVYFVNHYQAFDTGKLFNLCLIQSNIGIHGEYPRLQPLHSSSK